LDEFQKMDHEEQRTYVDDKQCAQKLYHVLFNIVKNIKGDLDLTKFALALINGILEDKRTRVKTLVEMQKSSN